MKNKNLIGLITVSVLMTITVLNPTIAAEPSIIVTSYEIFPLEFMPGDRGILTLTIQNAETQATSTKHYGDATDSFTIVENNGVVINKIWVNPDYDDNGKKIKSTVGTTGYKDFGNIAPGASFQLSFELIAEENISEGYYFLNVRIDLEKDSYEDITFPIEVRVSNETVDLISTNVPSKISVGGATDISLSIVNKRNNDIDSITISSDENNDLDFNPESIFIGSLESGKSENILFSINPSEMGKKTLSLNLSYKNGDNQHYQKYDVPIEIIEVLDVAPIFTDLPSTIKKDKSARIGLEIYNAKTESITGVIITPIIETTVIPSQYFIGTMDPDDVFSASFDIYSDMLDYGNHTIKFKVSFKQGSEYYETPSISHSFKVISGEGTNYQSSSNDNSESS
ncbi:COG1361 S-layer family protein [Thermoplasmatota archaeon]